MTEPDASARRIRSGATCGAGTRGRLLVVERVAPALAEAVVIGAGGIVIMEPEIMSLMLMWECGAGSETSAIAAGKKRTPTGAVDLPGIGRGACQTSMLAGNDESTRIFTTQAWDDDTACYVTVAGMSKDTAAIAKDTLAAVTPDSLK